MTAAAPVLPFAVDAVAAQRWAAQPVSASPWLHEEVARRMAERLDIIRLPVQQWAHWLPARSGLQGHALVAARYPGAQCWRVQTDAAPTPAARWWQRLGRPRSDTVVAHAPDGQAQLVWANMLAHQQSDVPALLSQWLRALAVGGFVMFSCLGPDTLQQLRAVYARMGWPPPAQDFMDMHDWGDMLLAAGFADPVVDMEKLTLTFDTPERLLAELRELGRNLHPARFAGLRTPRWRDQLLRALDAQLRPSGGGALSLTFELIYGHALKPAPRHAVQAETSISLDAMRQTLKTRRSP